MSNTNTHHWYKTNGLHLVVVFRFRRLERCGTFLAIAVQLLRELYWSFVLRSSLLVVQISNTKCSIFSASGNNVRFFCFVIWKNERRNRFFAQHALAVGCCCGPHTSFGLDVMRSFWCKYKANTASRLDYRVRIMFVVDYSENNFFLDCARKRADDDWFLFFRGFGNINYVLISGRGILTTSRSSCEFLLHFTVRRAY